MSDTPQLVTMKFSGKGCRKLFRGESGGHRWQRIPPTEKNGRVQSSTITVAVLGEETEEEVEVREEDVVIKIARGSGPGGQKRNKTETAVTLHHKSGMIVHCEDECSQSANKARAFEVLKARLQSQQSKASHEKRNNSRASQIGSGMRSDKIRTVQVQNGVVTNHHNGKKCQLAAYLKGDLQRLK